MTVAADDGFVRATPADVEALTALQRAAYARNRDILGVEPLPLLADYRAIVADYDVFLLAERGGRLAAAIVLRAEPGALLIWSLATAPFAQGRGLGGRMLAFAERRARRAGLARLRLYTGEKLADNIAWYRRSGFAIDRVERADDRSLVHMSRPLAATGEG